MFFLGRNKAISSRRSRIHAVMPAAGTGAVDLKPVQSGVAKFVATSFFAIVWNGVVAVSLWAMFLKDEPLPAFSFLFMAPFVLVGIGCIGYVVYSFLAIFNPRPQLRLNPGALPLGTSAELEWIIIGPVDRIKHLGFWLEAREEAQYRQGTRTVTASSLFEKILLFETDQASAMRVGKTQLTVPEFTMHSFEAPNNKIKWTLKVHGDVPRWPDIDLEFRIAVLPLPPAQG